jgi:hypothetical protein
MKHNPPPSFEPMSTFDPSRAVLVHDQLNDNTFAWLPEWRQNYEQSATKSHYEGIIEWDGLLLDGWCEPLGG